jgi:proteasome assembly chaperone (PAC2) family protein
MNFLKGAEGMRNPRDLQYVSQSKNFSLIVGWTYDAGKLGEVVTDYFIQQLGGQLFFEINPEEYFTISGVTVEDDIVQFPESRFYVCPKYDLLLFKSTPPVFGVYQFFNRVLDIAENDFKVNRVYTIGGMVSLSSHTGPRRLIGTFSSKEAKESLSSYEIESESDFETPSGQRPTLNSFLLWMTQRRHITGVNLWMPVPFYLMSVGDPKSQKKVLEFFHQHLNLRIDLTAFDQAIIKQNTKLNEMRDNSPDLDNYMTRLENNETLSEDENLKVAEQIEEYLKKDP